jgi:hypothetical protein
VQLLHRLVDHDDVDGVAAILGGERPAGAEGDAERREVLRGDHRATDLFLVEVGHRRAAFDLNDRAVDDRAEWQAGGVASGCHAGQRPRALQQVPVERAGERRLGILRLRKADARGQQAGGLEAAVDVRQTLKARDEQSRPDEQHEGQRDLAHDEDAANACAAARRRHAPRALFHRLAEVYR